MRNAENVLVITSSWDFVVITIYKQWYLLMRGISMFNIIQIVLVYYYALITWDRPQLQIDIKETNNLLLKIVTQISLYCVFVIVWDLLVLPTSSWTHRRRATQIRVGNLTTIGSDNGLSPCWLQANIWNNAGILLIPTKETNVSEILIEICKFNSGKCI